MLIVDMVEKFQFGTDQIIVLLINARISFVHEPTSCPSVEHTMHASRIVEQNKSMNCTNSLLIYAPPGDE